MANELDEKFESDDKVSTVEDPVTPEGGKIKKRRADLNKEVDPNPGKIAESKDKDEDDQDDDDDDDDDDEDDKDVKEAFTGLFEGTDLSEEFKEKATLVFEAAVNEAAKEKALVIAEALEEEFETKLEEALSESMEEIIENLDSYLDYVVETWMKENELAIESGIKVEMAESFMSGLKSLFEEHNVQIDEETVDVVSALEEEAAKYKEEVNEAINENIALKDEILGLKAHLAFNEVAEGLTTSQVEKLRSLSENLDVEDIADFKQNVKTLKESFFSKKQAVITESVYDEEDEVLVEETKAKRSSPYDSVSAIVAALDAKNNGKK